MISRDGVNAHMQESRLFKILYYLLDHGHTTARELAEQFEVSLRTIYRDIDALSDSGIPLYTEQGRNGGIWLMEEFVLDRALFSEEEQKSILAALQSLDAAQFIHPDPILNKLSALFRVNSDQWLETDFSRWGDVSNDNQKFEGLKTAVLHHKCVDITYTSVNGEIRNRVVEPLKLMFKSSSWYLKAYCREKQDYRIFKLTRILNLTILNESFLPHPFPAQTGPPPQSCISILLRFPKEMAYRVYDEFDVSQIRQQSNGDFIVTAQMPEDEWLIGFLLSFGPSVEIIEPVSLRITVAEQVRLAYEKHKT